MAKHPSKIHPKFGEWPSGAGYKGVPELMLREMPIYGDPEDVRRQLELFRDAGVQLFIMSFEPGRQLDELKLFGSEVAKHF
ncbi:MAG: hypothetical protein WB661_05440 [Candidatus Bathyarchaeia archaeon]